MDLMFKCMNIKSLFIISLFIFSCNNIKKNKVSSDLNTPSNTEGMVFIEGGEFLMGADNDQAKDDEYPKHKVIVNSFWMDQTEVTNTQFNEFVDATGYITTAEKAIDWEEIKKILPPGTPKPNDSLLAPASLVFFESNTTDLYDYTQWWKLKKILIGDNHKGKEVVFKIKKTIQLFILVGMMP